MGKNSADDDSDEDETNENGYSGIFMKSSKGELPINVIDGPWASKDDYISAHYRLLREDVAAPLRNAIATYRDNPAMSDDKDLCVYVRVSLPDSPCGTKMAITQLII